MTMCAKLGIIVMDINALERGPELSPYTVRSFVYRTFRIIILLNRVLKYCRTGHFRGHDIFADFADF